MCTLLVWRVELSTSHHASTNGNIVLPFVQCCASFALDGRPTLCGGLEMSHLLHIDSSVRGDDSVSRRLTARTADRWRAAHPDGTVTYRDLGPSPIPHLDAATGLARMVTAKQRTPAQDASFALSAELIDEIKQANT